MGVCNLYRVCQEYVADKIVKCVLSRPSKAVTPHPLFQIAGQQIYPWAMHFLSLSFVLFQYDSTCCVCTPVTGSTKLREWLTIWCWYWGRRRLTARYARHESDLMMLPGRATCCKTPRSIPAVLSGTICMYPTAGVELVSTIPNTHPLLCWGCRPRWYLGLCRKSDSSTSRMMPGPPIWMGLLTKYWLHIFLWLENHCMTVIFNSPVFSVVIFTGASWLQKVQHV